MEDRLTDGLTYKMLYLCSLYSSALRARVVEAALVVLARVAQLDVAVDDLSAAARCGVVVAELRGHVRVHVFFYFCQNVLIIALVVDQLICNWLGGGGREKGRRSCGRVSDFIRVRDAKT